MKRVIAIGLLAFFALPAFADNESQQGRMEANAGLGFRFGLAGVGFEYFVGNNVSVSANVGYLLDRTYNFGASVYLWSEPERWCPIISVSYGTVDQSLDHVYYRSYSSTHESAEAVSYGVGFKKMWGSESRNGMLIGVSYVPNRAYDYDVHVLPHAGYQFRFK